MQEDQEIIDKIYEIATHSLIKEKNTPTETIDELIRKGIDSETAEKVVSHIQSEINTAQKKRNKKDMIIGALFCLGGILGTLSDSGYVFWGAIVFGGFQVLKGSGVISFENSHPEDKNFFDPS